MAIGTPSGDREIDRSPDAVGVLRLDFEKASIGRPDDGPRVTVTDFEV